MRHVSLAGLLLAEDFGCSCVCPAALVLTGLLGSLLGALCGGLALLFSLLLGLNLIAFCLLSATLSFGGLKPQVVLALLGGGLLVTDSLSFCLTLALGFGFSFSRGLFCGIPGDALFAILLLPRFGFGA
ncbi:hypothetical protein D3C77_617590 [compost metagenome]